jgi:hypothetical protein
MRAFGLSNGNPGTSLTEIKFALRLQAGIAEVRESGLYRADTTFTRGDVLRVAVAAGRVRYSKNGQAFYTSTQIPSYPLLVDTSFSDSGAAITDPMIAGTSAPASGTSGSAPGTAAVQWTNMVNVAYANATLTKTGGCNGCPDAGAVSAQKIASGDGYVQFTATETGNIRVIGLSNGNAGTSIEEIAFAMKLTQSTVEIRHRGAYMAEGTFVTGDVLRIALVKGQAQYSRNGIVFYATPAAPVYPLVVDTSLLNSGSTFANVVISGALQ